MTPTYYWIWHSEMLFSISQFFNSESVRAQDSADFGCYDGGPGDQLAEGLCSV